MRPKKTFKVKETGAWVTGRDVHAFCSANMTFVLVNFEKENGGRQGLFKFPNVIGVPTRAFAPTVPYT